MRIPAIKTSFALSLLSAASLAIGGLSLAGCGTEEDGDGGGSGKINLTYPKGGETFKEGDSVYITWTVKNKDEFTSVQPRISLDDGASWIDLRPGGSISTSSTSWGRWGWKVDSVIVNGAKKATWPSTTVRFRVMEYSTQIAEMISTSAKASTIQAK